MFLLENGAEPNVSPEGCNSALQEAIAFPAFDVVSVLIDAKANLNHVGKNGNTVLHTVFSKGMNVINCHTQSIIFSTWS